MRRGRQRAPHADPSLDPSHSPRSVPECINEIGQLSRWAHISGPIRCARPYASNPCVPASIARTDSVARRACLHQFRHVQFSPPRCERPAPRGIKGTARAGAGEEYRGTLPADAVAGRRAAAGVKRARGMAAGPLQHSPRGADSAGKRTVLPAIAGPPTSTSRHQGGHRSPYGRPHPCGAPVAPRPGSPPPESIGDASSDVSVPNAPNRGYIGRVPSTSAECSSLWAGKWRGWGRRARPPPSRTHRSTRATPPCVCARPAPQTRIPAYFSFSPPPLATSAPLC